VLAPIGRQPVSKVAERDARGAGADRQSGQHGAALVAGFGYLDRAPASRAAGGDPGVHPLVDLQADLLDQARGDRGDHGVVLAAKFLVRCRRGGDVVTDMLIHADKIHLEIQARLQPDRHIAERRVRESRRPRASAAAGQIGPDRKWRERAVAPDAPTR